MLSLTVCTVVCNCATDVHQTDAKSTAGMCGVRSSVARLSPVKDPMLQLNKQQRNEMPARWAYSDADYASQAYTTLTCASSLRAFFFVSASLITTPCSAHDKGAYIMPGMAT